jgi:hypothetical protein
VSEAATSERATSGASNAATPRRVATMRTMSMESQGQRRSPG